MNQDRRQFYRIDKWVALEFQFFDSETDLSEQHKPALFKVTPHFMLHLELDQLNQTIETCFAKLDNSNSPVNDLLKLLNKKIDSITKSLSQSEHEGFNLFTEVNLSEGGLSFNLDKPIQLETNMILRMIVPESQTGLRLFAVVKRCLSHDEQYEIGIEFQRMPEVCRAELARLIFRSQIEQKQAMKES